MIWWNSWERDIFRICDDQKEAGRWFKRSAIDTEDGDNQEDTDDV